MQSGVVVRGMILVRHLEVKPPVLSYPVGTWWSGVPNPIPDGIYVDAIPRTALIEETTLQAQLETTRWHSIVTAPMPHRLLLGLEWFGGQYVATQPELADALCTSLDSLKRAIAHYRALRRLTSGIRGITLVKNGQSQRQLFDSLDS